MRSIFFAFLVVVYTHQAEARTECRTGASVADDYCYTYFEYKFSVASGGKFGDLSLVISGHWMVHEPDTETTVCSISFSGQHHSGVYRALPWSSVSIDENTKRLFSRDGKKVTKNSAPFAGCIFSPASSLELLKSLRNNTRYEYKRSGKVERFYRDEVFEVNDAKKWVKDFDRALIEHANVAKERTMHNPESVVDVIIDRSIFDGVLEIFND